MTLSIKAGDLIDDSQDVSQQIHEQSPELLPAPLAAAREEQRRAGPGACEDGSAR